MIGLLSLPQPASASSDSVAIHPEVNRVNEKAFMSRPLVEKYSLEKNERCVNGRSGLAAPDVRRSLEDAVKARIGAMQV